MNKQNLIPKVKARKCIHSQGNGASYFICNLTGKRCLYQRYCKNKRLFECTADKDLCKNFERSEK